MLRPVHPQGGTTLKEKKWGESGTWWDLHLGAIIFISGVKWLICQITIWFQQGRNIVYSVLAFLRLVIQDLQQSLVKDLPHFVTPLWGTYCCSCALLKEVRLLIIESLLLNFFSDLMDSVLKWITWCPVKLQWPNMVQRQKVHSSFFHVSLAVSISVWSLFVLP